MSAKEYSVLTAVGGDRPGLVREISSAIHGAGCNLEDSRMAVLAGEFAVILLLSGEHAAVESFGRSAKKLEQELDLRITLKQTEQSPEREHLSRALIVTGADQPGIVHRVSEALASRGINVASLESRLGHAAFTGTPIFTLQAELQVPDASALDTVREQLDHVCDELNLSFTLEEIG